MNKQRRWHKQRIEYGEREAVTLSRKTSLLGILVACGIASGGFIYYNHQKPIDMTNQRPPIERINIGQGVDMEFVRIEPGSFTMGSSLYVGEGDEAPEHNVSITKPFYMGKYEVTQEQWQLLMGSNPSHFIGDHKPVDSVSWDEAQSFLLKLQAKTKHSFTLPTEAQWEYAARAGSTTRWDFGDYENALNDYAWFTENSGHVTHPVGQKKPNAWGLYDLYGNVQEWCSDWYANPYPKGDAADPKGPNSGNARVLRGGAWGDDYTMVRATYRNAVGADAKNPGIGFRIVMAAE